VPINTKHLEMVTFLTYPRVSPVEERSQTVEDEFPKLIRELYTQAGGTQAP
jgi:hypothetical protein